MAISRFEAEKFTGKNDFGLWRLKMRAMQGLADALKGDEKGKGKDEEADPKETAKREEMFERAHSAIILNLGDKVLREVAKEKTAAGIWSKLESLYMTKSLANRLYVKQRLYSFKIIDEKGIEEQLETFNKTLDDLENIDVKLEDEDKAIILLNALPRSFEHLKDAMLYGRETSITLEEVQSALKCKELQKEGSKATDSVAESLDIKGTKGKKGFKKKGTGQKQSKFQKPTQESEKETRSCHYCKKPGHLKKNCFS